MHGDGTFRSYFGAVCVPILDSGTGNISNVTHDWANAMAALGGGLAITIMRLQIRNYRVDIAKQRLAEMALMNNCSFLYMADDDVIPPPDALMKMIKLWKSDPKYKIISGVYFSKSDPSFPLVFEGNLVGSKWDWTTQDLIKADGAGAGALFVDCEIFKKLPKPWFSCDYYYEDPRSAYDLKRWNLSDQLTNELSKGKDADLKQVERLEAELKDLGETIKQTQAGGFDPNLMLDKRADGSTTEDLYFFKKAKEYLKDEGQLWVDCSVTPDTPIFIRRNNKFIDILPIEELGPSHSDSKRIVVGKYKHVDPRIEVLTKEGRWSQVKYLFRHSVTKDMYTVTTGSGFTKLTGDHSVFSHGKDKEVREMKIGDTIDYVDSPRGEATADISEEYAYALGMFVAEGWCGRRSINGQKRGGGFSVSQDSPELLEKIRPALENHWMLPFDIETLHRNKGPYKGRNLYALIPRGWKMDMIDWFDKHCYTRAGDKRIPMIVLNAGKAAKRAFLEGCWAGDGHGDLFGDQTYSRYTTSSFTLAAGVAYLMDSIGLKYGVQTRQDKPNIIDIVRLKGAQRKIKAGEIKKMSFSKEKAIVYDIETVDESHSFVAGVGCLSHHNSIQCMHQDKRTGRLWGLSPDMPQARPRYTDKLTPGKQVVLDLGCGNANYWLEEGQPIRVDIDPKYHPDIVADARFLPLNDCFADSVNASHLLEHFSFRETISVLKEWVRVLKIGGKLQIIVPNIRWAAQNIMNPVPDQDIMDRTAYFFHSAQAGPLKDGAEDIHRAIFTPESLKAALEKLGTLKDIEIHTSEGNYGNWKDPDKLRADGMGYNLIAVATKAKHDAPVSLKMPLAPQEGAKSLIGDPAIEEPKLLPRRSTVSKHERKISHHV